MKQKLFFLFLISQLLSFSGQAQTIIWSENFADPPANWTLEGNWAFDQGDLNFYYYPVYENYDFSAISPEIQIPNYPSQISFDQFIDPYLTGVTNETSEIWVISGDEEVKIFSYELLNGAWGVIGGQTLNQSLDQFAGQTIQFKFRSWGATTNSLWGWTIYNVRVLTTFDNELCAIETNGPANVLPGVGGSWYVLFENTGQLAQSNFSVRLFSYKTGEQIGEATYSGTVNAGEFGEVVFDWVPQDYQNTSLYGVVDAANDQFQANNRSKGHFVRVEPPIQSRVLLWDNDNNIPTILNDETGQLEQANVGIEKALTDAGINYILVNILPEDLSMFNLIICTMGSYCLS